jgi:GntR family transcriptional regulator
MFVNEGARVQLLKDERERFLDIEWPKVVATIERLGLDAADLLQDNSNNDVGEEND